VTAAPGEFYTPPEGWTTDDLDALPEDGIRRELIDGVLHVSPSPASFHQIIAGRLMVYLGETCPPGYVVTQAVEVRVNKIRSFIPDVLAVTAEAAARNPRKFQPHEVLLAVEIVSPCSTGMDRVAKPGFYAEAGIPFYWRVEIEPVLSVHTYLLDPTRNTYGSIGDFTKEIDLLEPWEIKIPIEWLVPRFMAGSVDRDPDRGGEHDLG
jgi:Uma2 family endonuclease